MKEITLTTGQAAALTNLKEFLKSKDKFFLLTGSAGTGKTFILSEVTDLEVQGDIIGTAPTHKACAVLSERLPDIETCTIHRFLGLRPRRSKDKTVLIRRNDYDPSSNFAIRLVMFDEGSMGSTDILKYVIEDAETWDRKYIVVMDRYQLNPVGEMHTPFFDLPYGQWKSELTEIVRQAEGNPIIKSATAIRDAIIAGKQPEVLAGKVDGLGVYLLKKDAWLEKLREHTDNHDPDSYRVLAYKNDTVRSYNQIVRGMMGKDTSVPFSVGEFVVVNEAFSQDDEVILNTGMEFVVISMEPMTHESYSSLKGWVVTLMVGDVVIPQKIQVLDHDNCGAGYTQQIAKLVESAHQNNDWRPYYRLAESWCDLRPLHALTAHKSQGSTFDNTFIDFRDIYSNRVLAEADRCLYVCMTRARYNIYVLY